VTLLVSIGIGLAAVSIREFAVAAPAAILIAAWARNRTDDRAYLAWVSGFLAAGIVCILVVAASIPGRGAYVTVDQRWANLLGPAFATLAAVLLPAAVLGMGRRIGNFSPIQVILAAGVVGSMFVLPNWPLIGNYWMPTGVAGDVPLLSGTRDPVIGAGPWALSEQLAAFAAILVAALGLRWGRRNLANVSSLSAATDRAIQVARSREAPILLFLALYSAELVVYALIGKTFDRFLYEMVPAAAILLLRGTARPTNPRWSRPASHAALAWLAASAFVIAA
jgi:predicted NBD/HSP70 family sugar kinase